MTAVYEPVDQSRFAAVAELAGLHGPRYAWRAFAACRGEDTALFFPGVGDAHLVARAKAICARCPVADICLDVAVRNEEHHGVWGGKSGKGLRSMRTDRWAGIKADVLGELDRLPGGRWDSGAVALADRIGQGGSQVARAVAELERSGVVTVDRLTDRHITAITLNKETPAP